MVRPQGRVAARARITGETATGCKFDTETSDLADIRQRIRGLDIESFDITIEHMVGEDVDYLDALAATLKECCSARWRGEATNANS